ncbi:MAG: hypothetical protein ACRDTD_22055 [Pseudonocardiaceae bacterium]
MAAALRAAPNLDTGQITDKGYVLAGRIAIVLGLATAGLVFAMQEVIGVLAGWVSILTLTALNARTPSECTQPTGSE